uniref:Transposase Tc1-like domain-containing protein n=1 Tax=Oreochromis aureus TaxID=47969 RepID=A0A668SAL2_OREAU
MIQSGARRLKNKNKNVRHSETNTDRKRSGRPIATTESEDTFLRVNSLRDRRLTGQQLQAQLNSGCRRVAAGKPLLRSQNKTKRLAWAMKQHHWTTEDWKKLHACIIR